MTYNVFSGTLNPTESINQSTWPTMLQMLIIFGLLCAILCITIVHSAMHTHINRPNSSLHWVLSHWAHFTVLGFIFVYVLLHACDPSMHAMLSRELARPDVQSTVCSEAACTAEL